MSLFDAAASAIVEGTAHIIERIARRRFCIDKEKAKRIGEYTVLLVLMGAGLVVTIVYS